MPCVPTASAITCSASGSARSAQTPAGSAPCWHGLHRLAMASIAGLARVVQRDLGGLAADAVGRVRMDCTECDLVHFVSPRPCRSPAGSRHVAAGQDAVIGVVEQQRAAFSSVLTKSSVRGCDDRRRCCPVTSLVDAYAARCSRTRGSRHAHRRRSRSTWATAGPGARWSTRGRRCRPARASKFSSSCGRTSLAVPSALATLRGRRRRWPAAAWSRGCRKLRIRPASRTSCFATP